MRLARQIGIFVWTAMWLCLTLSFVEAGGQTRAKNACELLTPAEIAKVLNVAEVKKDDIKSGEHVMTHVDICNWFVKEGSDEGIEVRLYPAKVFHGSALVASIGAKGEAVGHDHTRDQQAHRVTGVGDEAIYSPNPVGKGGGIALRTPTGAVSIVGFASKEGFVALAKLAASRM